MARTRSTSLTAAAVLKRLRAHADPGRAAAVSRFFKTGPGQYGEGDRFLGLTLPVVRQVSREFRALPRAELIRLLKSPWHEARTVALIIMVDQHRRGSSKERAALHRVYLRHTRYVNNWDLVDLSAGQMVGAQLEDGDRRMLDRLAAAPLLWERRIAMIATSHYIRKNDFRDALRIAERLLEDEHDLIHKAVGWMLREIGKRDLAAEERFLDRFSSRLPRTALRYAIERFPEARRRDYLSRDRPGAGLPARRRSGKVAGRKSRP
jgi:3-methyladenine DNA glycosylase AlkD